MEDERFEIGDRVGVRPEYGRIGNAELWPGDMFGTVCMIRNDNSVGICFDENIRGHACRGNCPHGHGWFIPASYLFHETEISSIPAEAILEVLSNG